MERQPSNRREENRYTTMLPALVIDGSRWVLQDFSSTGLRCQVPETYRTLGATGEATIEIQAAGYRVTKHIFFTVRHVQGDTIGASFEVLSETSEASGTFF